MNIESTHSTYQLIDNCVLYPCHTNKRHVYGSVLAPHKHFTFYQFAHFFFEFYTFFWKNLHFFLKTLHFFRLAIRSSSSFNGVLPCRFISRRCCLILFIKFKYLNKIVRIYLLQFKPKVTSTAPVRYFAHLCWPCSNDKPLKMSTCWWKTK